MLIGRMDKRIQLQQYLGSAWNTQFTVWAEFRKPDPGLKTLELAGNMTSVITREIGIRYNSSVRQGWRAVWEGRVFDVLHTYDYGKNTTILICQEVVM